MSRVTGRPKVAPEANHSADHDKSRGSLRKARRTEVIRVECKSRPYLQPSHNS